MEHSQPSTELPKYENSVRFLKCSRRLAQASGSEIGVDRSVGGAITAHLNNVPWDEPFSLVVRASGGCPIPC